MLRHSEVSTRPHDVCTLGRAFALTCLRSFVRSIPVAVACVALLASAPTAFSASDPDPRELWEAFPLYPNGKRLGEEERAAVPNVPKITPIGPKAGGATADGSGTNFGVLALFAGAGIVILAVAAHAAMRIRYFRIFLFYIGNDRRSFLGHKPGQPGPLWTAVPWGAHYTEAEGVKHREEMDVAPTHRSQKGQSRSRAVWQARAGMHRGSGPTMRRRTSILHLGPALRRITGHVRDAKRDE